LLPAVSLENQTTDLLLDCEAHRTLSQWNLQIRTFGRIERKLCHLATPACNHPTHQVSSTRNMHQSHLALLSL
jgi:hypothetical protein